MSTVELKYGNESFSILDRDLDDVQRQIDDIVASGQPGWVEAVDGHGSRVPYRVLITAGIPITLALLPSE